MRAVVVEQDYRNYELGVGDEIEVVGFASDAGDLRAVWRDDQGHIWDISTRAIRLLPRVEVTAQGLDSVRAA